MTQDGLRLQHVTLQPLQSQELSPVCSYLSANAACPFPCRAAGGTRCLVVLGHPKPWPIRDSVKYAEFWDIFTCFQAAVSASLSVCYSTACLRDTGTASDSCGDGDAEVKSTASRDTYTSFIDSILGLQLESQVWFICQRKSARDRSHMIRRGALS